MLMNITGANSEDMEIDSDLQQALAMSMQARSQSQILGLTLHCWPSCQVDQVWMPLTS